MVTVTGSMVVKTINGRNGYFNVANLYSEVGNYVIDYEGLDEYNAGTYQGEFIITKTEQRTRNFGVGKIIEPVAYLEGVNLYDAAEGKVDEVPEAIPDPLDEEASSTASKVSHKQHEPIKQASALDEKALKQLFGVWPLSDEVRLDPTVGRSTFRQQAAYLKSAGFKYNPTEQVWIKKH